MPTHTQCLTIAPHPTRIPFSFPRANTGTCFPNPLDPFLIFPSNERFRSDWGCLDPPPYFKIGTKTGNVLHTRLRIEMSQLNSHLFQIQRHDTPECSCGYKTESVTHFIFTCPNYSLQREELFGCIREIIGESFARMSPLLKLRLILQGDGLGGEDGCAVAYHFQKFLVRSRRFITKNPP